ncbi:MAG: site-specific integrase [Candidatus Babeliales bacterium]|jgi:integrase
MNKTIKNILRPLTPEQLAEIQKQDPEVNFQVISEEKLLEYSELAHRMQKDEEEFPILKYNDASYKFLRHLDEIDHNISEFREELEDTPMKVALGVWLKKTSERVRKKYAKYIQTFFDRKIMHEVFADGKDFTIGGFRYIRHQAAIDYIKKTENLDSTIKQEMIDCYISFVNYLDLISYRWFKMEALLTPTAYKMSPDMVNEVLSFSDWRTFIDVLYEINHRDSIIARLIMQGGRRISEVLDITVSQINPQDNTICFNQKNNLLNISFHPHLLEELNGYVGSTVEYRKISSAVFVTRTGNPVTRSRLNYSFAQASSIAGVTKVTPESLRAIWVALKQQGYEDWAILANKDDRKKVGKKNGNIKN